MPPKSSKSITDIYITTDSMFDSNTLCLFLKSTSKKPRKLFIFHKPDAAFGFGGLKPLLDAASSGNISIEFREFTSETSFAFLAGYLVGENAGQAKIYSILPEEYCTLDSIMEQAHIQKWNDVHAPASRKQQTNPSPEQNAGKEADEALQKKDSPLDADDMLFMSEDSGKFFKNQLMNAGASDEDINRVAVCMKQAEENHALLKEKLASEFGERAEGICKYVEKNFTLLYGCLFIRRRTGGK